MIKEFGVRSEERYEMIDITGRVKKMVEESGVERGVVLVFVPHSTAAILLTENESGLKQDFLDVFGKMVSGFEFSHDRIDSNADSHILSALIGQGKTIAIENGKLVLGTWQQIFLIELDGPKTRKIIVKFIEN